MLMIYAQDTNFNLILKLFVFKHGSDYFDAKFYCPMPFFLSSEFLHIFKFHLDKLCI